MSEISACWCAHAHTHVLAHAPLQCSPLPPSSSLPFWISPPQPEGSFLIPIIWKRDVCQSNHMDINCLLLSVLAHKRTPLHSNPDHMGKAGCIQYQASSQQVVCESACWATCVSSGDREGKEFNKLIDKPSLLHNQQVILSGYTHTLSSSQVCSSHLLPVAEGEVQCAMFPWVVAILCSQTQTHARTRSFSSKWTPQNHVSTVNLCI